jgi:electron transfer flavoprotein beta subunit
MNIVVCIKRVPETAESEVKVDESGKDIVKSRLTYDINEPDNYALEEAILLKEKFGGNITVISVGTGESDENLRMAIAKGADTAIRVDIPNVNELDGFNVAELIKAVIKNIQFDLILTGCIAKDDGCSQVGPMVAELLAIPHATLVTEVKIEGDATSNGKANVKRELEGGLLESLEIKLPALFTVQTGINEPRYASLIAIRRATAKEIKVFSVSELGLTNISSRTSIESLFVPPVGKRAEIIKGSADEVSTKLAGIIKEKGLL